MKNLLVPLLFSFSTFSPVFAQIEIAPEKSTRPAIIHTENSKPFSIGLNENAVLHFSQNSRLGLGTEFISNGIANHLNYGKFHILHNSGGNFSEATGSAHLVLDEAELGDYARLRFVNSFFLSGSTTKNYIKSDRFWDIAGIAGSSNVINDRLHFYNSENGNILTLTGDEKVGINDSSPERSLDVNGTARVMSYTETGDLSTPYKTKLIAFTSFPISCSGGTTYDFSLGVNENRVVSTDVLVQTGSSAFYPPNETFNNREYSYYVNGNNIYFTFKAVSGCQFATRGFRVWLTYTDSAIAMPTGNGP